MSAYIRTEKHRETVRKLGLSNKGKKRGPLTLAHKKKLSDMRKGKPLSLAHRQKLSESHKKDWTQNTISYHRLHRWVEQHLGQPNKCENCDSTDRKWYDWANISGEYKLSLDDWVRLCRICHYNIDNNAEKAWVTKRSII